MLQYIGLKLNIKFVALLKTKTRNVTMSRVLVAIMWIYEHLESRLMFSGYVIKLLRCDAE